MIRLTLIFMMLFSLLILLVVGYVAWRKLKKGLGQAWDKSVEAVDDQKQRWKEREQLKSRPDFLQKAWSQVEQIRTDSETLPPEWQALLEPLDESMQSILDLTFGDEKRADKVRRFYNTSLPAYASFVAKLRSDHGQLDAAEKQKAVDNLSVFKADFKNYEELIHEARKFDFDVLMDVIKVRLKR